MGWNHQTKYPRVSTRSPSREGEPAIHTHTHSQIHNRFNPLPLSRRGAPPASTDRPAPPCRRSFNPLPLSRRGAHRPPPTPRPATPGFNPLPLSRRGAPAGSAVLGGRAVGHVSALPIRLPAMNARALFQPAPPLAKGSPCAAGGSEGRSWSFNPLPLSRRGARKHKKPKVNRKTFQPAPPLAKGSPSVFRQRLAYILLFQPAPPLAKGSPGAADTTVLPYSFLFQPAPPLAKGSPRRSMRRRATLCKFQPAPPLAKGSPRATDHEAAIERHSFNPLPLSRRGAPTASVRISPHASWFQPAPPLAKGSPSAES